MSKILLWDNEFSELEEYTKNWYHLKIKDEKGEVMEKLTLTSRELNEVIREIKKLDEVSLND